MEIERYNDDKQSSCFRKFGLYKSDKTFMCSRSTIEKFSQCPTCFYVEHVIGLKPPPSPGWSLNNAVDELVKNETDRHRELGTTPEILEQYDFKVFHHEKLEDWRTMNKGIRFKDEERNIDFYGLIDDVFVNSLGELVIMDTKSISKQTDISESKHLWNNGSAYKRQLEIYSWLFQKNGFSVSSTGYLLYYNAIKKTDEFNGVMKFKTSLISLELDTSWIEPCITNMIECLQKPTIPPSNQKCNQCIYWKLMKSFLND